MGDRADRLSPSGLSTYRNCPKSWWHTYVEELPQGPPTREMLLGSFVHVVLENLMLMASLADRTLAAAKRIAAGAWQGESNEIAEYLGGDELLAFKWDAMWCLETFFKLFDPTAIEPVGVEMDLSCTLGDVPFVGKADLVADDAYDWKSGEAPEKGKPWSRDREREKLEQPLLYAAALREKGIRVQEAHLLFLSPHGRSGWLSAEATDEALDGAVERLQATWRLTRRDLARGHAEAYTGPLCGWCDFLAACPDGQREVRVRIRMGKNVGPGADIVG